MVERRIGRVLDDVRDRAVTASWTRANADAYGVGTWLTQQASVAAVQASGGWYWTATTLTVGPSTSRAPTPRCGRSVERVQGMMRINGAAVTACVEGIDFVGGYRRTSTRVAQFTAVPTFSYGVHASTA